MRANSIGTSRQPEGASLTEKENVSHPGSHSVINSLDSVSQDSVSQGTLQGASVPAPVTTAENIASLDDDEQAVQQIQQVQRSQPLVYCEPLEAPENTGFVVQGQHLKEALGLCVPYFGILPLDGAGPIYQTIIAFFGPYDVEQFFGRSESLKPALAVYYAKINLRTFSTHVHFFDETDYEQHFCDGLKKLGLAFNTYVPPNNKLLPPLDIRKTAVALDTLLSNLSFRDDQGFTRSNKGLLVLAIPGGVNNAKRDLDDFNDFIGDTAINCSPTQINFVNEFDSHVTFSGSPTSWTSAFTRIVMTEDVLPGSLGKDEKSHCEALTQLIEHKPLCARPPTMCETALAIHVGKLLGRTLFDDGRYTRCHEKIITDVDRSRACDFYMGNFSNNSFYTLAHPPLSSHPKAGVAGVWELGKYFEEQK